MRLFSPQHSRGTSEAVFGNENGQNSSALNIRKLCLQISVLVGAAVAASVLPIADLASKTRNYFAQAMEESEFEDMNLVRQEAHDAAEREFARLTIPPYEELMQKTGFSQEFLASVFEQNDEVGSVDCSALQSEILEKVMQHTESHFNGTVALRGKKIVRGIAENNVAMNLIGHVMKCAKENPEASGFYEVMERHRKERERKLHKAAPSSSPVAQSHPDHRN